MSIKNCKKVFTKLNYHVKIKQIKVKEKTMAVNISTNAINEILRNPQKLNDFTVEFTRNNDDRAYALMFAYRCYTLAKLNETNQAKFAKFNELNVETTADFGYLCMVISDSKDFATCDFKVRPILELYEALLRENWEIVKKERDSLNANGNLDLTPLVNVKICEAITNFLKEYVLNKSYNHTI